MALNVLQFGITVHLDFVIDDGAEIRAIVTDTGGAIESRVYRKQFREDRKEQ
jgi:3D (Asp-Asp-Asp) domain-containing protein